jgi:hypothetical protein
LAVEGSRAAGQRSFKGNEFGGRGVRGETKGKAADEDVRAEF